MKKDLQPTMLENAWVKLEPLREEHFEALYSVASDPLIWEQHPNPDRYQREVFSNYFKGAMESAGAMLIRDAQSSEIIGSSRFYDHDAEKKELKIGYTFFARHCWGKPYNRSAKWLMLEHAFGFAERVIFHVGAANMRSRKAMEKLGAVNLGEQEVAYYGEAPRLNVVYGIRGEDWAALKNNILS